MSARTNGTPAADPWLAYPVRIAGKAEETPGVATYDLEFLDPQIAEDYCFAPGQFNMLYIPAVGEAAISISGHADQQGTVPHTVRLAGNLTRTLDRLGEGGHLALRGPFGNPWPLEECAGRDVVIVAGGIGLAPLRPVIEHLLAHRDDYGRLTLLCGARSPEHLLYQEQYKQWEQQGALIDVTVDRSVPGWRGHVGVVPLLVDRLRLPEPEKTVFLICGPEVMMAYTVKSARRRRVPTSQIWVNMERNMNCAVGLCGHCQFGPEFICKDGPVLPYDRVAPFLSVKDL